MQQFNLIQQAYKLILWHRRMSHNMYFSNLEPIKQNFIQAKFLATPTTERSPIDSGVFPGLIYSKIPPIDPLSQKYQKMLLARGCKNSSKSVESSGQFPNK